MGDRRNTNAGRFLPAMDLRCGFDGLDDSAPICGKPAAIHAYAGSPDEGPSDYSMLACDTHAAASVALCWDWHEVGAVCDVPGTLWQARNRQGEGFCYWPAENEAHAEAIRYADHHARTTKNGDA